MLMKLFATCAAVTAAEVEADQEEANAEAQFDVLMMLPDRGRRAMQLS